MGTTNRIDQMEINGVIDFCDSKVTHEEFVDIFIDWVETNKWVFGGGISPYVEKDETQE